MNRRRLLLACSLLLTTPAIAQEPEKEITVETVPPVVVKTIPEAGTKDVDPGLKQIRVTFSKKMLDKSWSWVTVSKSTFPAIDGKPRYLADGRTCVVDVKLEPNHTYGVQFNSRRFGNFKDADGRSAVPYLLVFKTGGGDG